ncbi:hypothetical protein ACJDU8_00500 [Clostridium sp. WILCCON 0269]|uniref:ABC transporter permease n=1 Tax=Candidatus Clostridium eludens TaxID=3381663 RepID=A0ABW8SDQ2_9CLOT
MKKYLNRALIYKEWKVTYWILTPLILFSSKAFMISLLINQAKVQDELAYRIFFQMGISNYITIILVILMSYIMMNVDRKDSARDLISYMPFNIKQRMVSRIAVGEFVIFLSCLMGFIINTIMYEGNIGHLGKEIRFEYITFYLIISFLVYTIIYILFVYVQCLCKNEIFGVVLAAAILNLPVFMGELLYYFLRVRFYRFTYQLNSLTIRHYLSLPLNSKIINNKEYITGYKFVPSIIKLIIILAVICMLFILFIKRVKFGEGMMLKTSPKKEKVFKVFSSISIGIFAAKGLSGLLHRQEPLSIYAILVNIIFIIAVYFAYSQINKVIKLSNYMRGE